jgi:hypothetical protein
LYVLGSIVVVYASFQVGVNFMVVPYVAFSFRCQLKKDYFKIYLCLNGLWDIGVVASAQTIEIYGLEMPT